MEEIFNFPELLDCYRTSITYCVRLRKVTAEEMEFCKYRALTKVFDYVQAITRLENGFKMFTISDKVCICEKLRHAFKFSLLLALNSKVTLVQSFIELIFLCSLNAIIECLRQTIGY